jgi:hypothetical protein
MIHLQALLALALTLGAHAQPAGLLPDTAEGWTAREANLRFSPGDLFEYIDGGAEMFLSFGFTGGVSKTYTRTGQPDITVDLFDMSAPGNAFGVFAQSIERVDTTYGQGCQVSRGMIVFWKDRYYVSVLAAARTPAAEHAVASMAAQIDRAIPRRGALPFILSLLPEDSLSRASVRYFTHFIWQNSAFFISNENILGIGAGTEAVLARYTFNGAPLHALLVSYPGIEQAMRAEERFLSSYPPASGVDTPPLTATTHRAGHLLLITFKQQRAPGTAEEEDHSGAQKLFRRIESGSTSQEN